MTVGVLCLWLEHWRARGFEFGLTCDFAVVESVLFAIWLETKARFSSWLIVASSAAMSLVNEQRAMCDQYKTPIEARLDAGLPALSVGRLAPLCSEDEEGRRIS